MLRRTHTSAIWAAPAGPLAEEMGELGWQMTWLGTAVFVLVIVLLVVGLVRRQDAREVDERRAIRNWVVGGGVVLSSGLVAAVFVLTLIAMRQTALEPGEDGVRIEVVGHQWWWEVTYPDEGIVTANEIHLPVGRPVVLHLTSADVIHSFWVPELGGKIDMLPEDLNEYVIRADHAGTFQGVCAEFCGLQHTRMRFVAVASEQGQYTDWAQHEASDAAEPRSETARRGLQVFQREECGECHSVRGTGADGRKGPDLTHLASRRAIAAGTLDNTSENLREWISDPARFKEGIAMPSFELPPDEMDALIAYLEGLE